MTAAREPFRLDLSLLTAVRRWASGQRRVLLGVTGPPGVGKSTFAAALHRACGEGAQVVGMDGFHLADAELVRLGTHDRKGAPDTYDAEGFLALLLRLRAATEPVTYAPRFERSIEDPIANAVPVLASTPLVIIEGNYLLHDDGAWARARSYLDECWYVDAPDSSRLSRLEARHRRYGRSPAEAHERTLGSDQCNAEVIARGRPRADRIVDLAPGGT